MSDSPRDIRIFVAAHEERSFTKAAVRENATQSGVSQHIRKLEERYGVRLFSRAGSGVVPTPAGDEYYRHCLDVLRACQAAAASLQRYGRGLEGEIVVGLMPTMTRSALAPTLARFIDQHPNVVVRIVEAYSAVLTQQVRAGELAFAVVPASPEGVGLRSRHFARTPEVLVSRADSHLQHLAPVRLATLGALKMVLPAPQNARRVSLEAYFAANGVHVERLLELDAMFGTLDFVATSDWVTVLPGVMMTTDMQGGRFTVNPLADPPLALDLVLIESSSHLMSPAAEAFLNVLQAETGRINAAWGE
jgi:LysR family nitrogen assimilation transcriptional regulator